MDRFRVLCTTSAQPSSTQAELYEVVQSESQNVEHVGLVSTYSVSIESRMLQIASLALPIETCSNLVTNQASQPPLEF